MNVDNKQYAYVETVKVSTQQFGYDEIEFEETFERSGKKYRIAIVIVTTLMALAMLSSAPVRAYDPYPKLLEAVEQIDEKGGDVVEKFWVKTVNVYRGSRRDHFEGMVSAIQERINAGIDSEKGRFRVYVMLLAADMSYQKSLRNSSDLRRLHTEVIKSNLAKFSSSLRDTIDKDYEAALLKASTDLAAGNDFSPTRYLVKLGTAAQLLEAARDVLRESNLDPLKLEMSAYLAGAARVKDRTVLTESEKIRFGLAARQAALAYTDNNTDLYNWSRGFHLHITAGSFGVQRSYIDAGYMHRAMDKSELLRNGSEEWGLYETEANYFWRATFCDEENMNRESLPFTQELCDLAERERHDAQRRADIVRNNPLGSSIIAAEKAAESFARDMDELIQGKPIQLTRTNLPFVASLSAIIIEDCKIPTSIGERAKLLAFATTTTLTALIGERFSNPDQDPLDAFENGAEVNAGAAAGNLVGKQLGCGVDAKAVTVGVLRSLDD